MARAGIGKRGDPGRFVTLRSGRKIFIPKGYKGKWADVRGEILLGKPDIYIRSRLPKRESVAPGKPKETWAGLLEALVGWIGGG